MMKWITYQEAASQMRPGDVIAFSGNSLSSKLLFMRDGLSHIGILIDAPAPTLLEAAIYFSGYRLRMGIIASPLVERYQQYKGDVYWLPLSSHVREQTYDQGGYAGLQWFSRAYLDKPFNYCGGAAVVLSVHGIGERLQDFLYKHPNRGYHCGELVAVALRCIGICIEQDPATVHPADLCALDLYAENRYHLI
jgi:hypothetical protein